MSSYAQVRLFPLQPKKRLVKNMCNSLVIMPIMDGKHRLGERPVKCRKCDECRKERVRNWIGRINAEMKTASKIDFVTLTYADHVGHHENLHYRDVQKLFYKLRKDGYRFKYIVAGEYGTQNTERAHWHIIFMWDGKVPDVVRKPAGFAQHSIYRIHWKYWGHKKIPHGYVQFDEPRSTQGVAAYIMKYLDKGDDFSEMRFSLNIGHEYIEKRCRDKARQGHRLFPYLQMIDREHIRYTVEGNNNSAGEMYYYFVQKGSGLYKKMVMAYLEEWAMLRPDQKLPPQYEVFEVLQEMLQYNFQNAPNVIRYLPQLHVYANRHYAFNLAGELVEPAQQNTERLVAKWQKEKADAAIIPNAVQREMYQELETSLQKGSIRSLMQQQPLSKRERPRIKRPPQGLS